MITWRRWRKTLPLHHLPKRVTSFILSTSIPQEKTEPYILGLFICRNMSEKFSRAFYNSVAWKTTREAYKKSKGGLCEDCLEKGLITPGAEVHHINPLTPDNITDTSVSLNWDNLCLLCSSCHHARHNSPQRRSRKRYWIELDGSVTIKAPPVDDF